MKRNDPRMRRAYLKHAKSAGPTKGWANEYYARAATIGQLHKDHKVWKAPTFQGITQWHYVKFEEDLRLYFSGNTFVFVKYIGTLDQMKRVESCIYTGKNMAYMAYSFGKITWNDETTKPVVADTPSA